MSRVARQAAASGEALTPGSRRLRAAGGSLLAFLAILLVAMAAAGVTLWTCPFHELTGSSCLTCGMTRSFAAIGEGDLGGALRYHPFGPVLLGVLALASVGALAEALVGRRLLVAVVGRGARVTVMLLGALWLAYGIARMAVELCA